MSQETEKPKRGRPRSTEARARALRAAREILLRDGLGQLTIEKVARRSGTGKPTIYRHWANAQELALAALIDTAPDAATDPALPPAQALEAQLARLCAAFSTTRGRQVALALASADPDSEFTRAFRNRVILESREEGRALLETAIADGTLPAPDDIETLLDMIYGPLFFRLLAGHRPLDASLARSITAQVFT